MNLKSIEMENKNLSNHQSKIAKTITSHYIPGTLEEHDDIIEIDNFVELWPPKELPKLGDIEEVMELLGFKDDISREGFGFYVLIKEEEA